MYSKSEQQKNHTYSKSKDKKRQSHQQIEQGNQY